MDQPSRARSYEKGPSQGGSRTGHQLGVSLVRATPGATRGTGRESTYMAKGAPIPTFGVDGNPRNPYPSRNTGVNLWQAVIIVTAGVATDSPIVSAVIGGVFLLVNTVVTVWLTTHVAERRKREGSYKDRSNTRRNRPDQRRSTDSKPYNHQYPHR